jgi:membrane protease subunit HflC
MAGSWRLGSGAVFALAVLVLLALASVTVVGENQQAVILRGDQPDRVVNRFRPAGPSGAGAILTMPLAERVVVLDRGLFNHSAREQTVGAIDQPKLVVDADATLRIFDPVRLVKRLGSSQALASRIDSLLTGILRNELAKVDSARIALPSAGGALPRARQALDAALREYGVQVIDLRLSRTSLLTGARQATLASMAERREAMARDERALGTREAQRITSEAEAQAASILQQSGGRDPEFYDFYRAMKSYEATLADPDTKDKATIILPPDSGYLRQFNPR